MEDLVHAIVNGFGVLDQLPALPDSAKLFDMTPEKVSIAAIFSGAGSVILSKFTGSVGYITMPMNYCALFMGAMLGNWALQGVRIPMLDATFQTPMLFAVAGMMISALAILMFTKTESY
jgi:hypothetical protein